MILPVEISDSELELCIGNARLASIGGGSQVRGSVSRKKNLLEDQMVGQIGNLAGAKCLFGDQGVELYSEARRRANTNPYSGDDGSDLPGYKIDFKASMIRNLQRSLLDYRLPVRPRELHLGTAYVLILIPPKFGGAFVMGWADTKDFNSVETEGVFSGAHVLSFNELRPIDTLEANGYATASTFIL